MDALKLNFLKITKHQLPSEKHLLKNMITIDIWKGAMNNYNMSPAFFKKCMRLSETKRKTDLIWCWILTSSVQSSVVHSSTEFFQAPVDNNHSLHHKAKYYLTPNNSVVYCTRCVMYLISNLVHNPRNMKLLIYSQCHVVKYQLS